jgi:small subunit ribosomal protein S29
MCSEGYRYKNMVFLFFRCKTLVAINGFNAFFHPRTRVVTETKVKVPPSKITLTEAFVEITKYDWVSI